MRGQFTGRLPPPFGPIITPDVWTDPTSVHYDPPDWPCFMSPQVPPPPADSPRPCAFFDTECYPNYWLLKFKPRDGPVYTFELQDGSSFSATDIVRMRLLFTAYCVVSFNGNHYDVPMLTAALLGYTPAQLKWQNDRIIVEQVKPWELGLPEWKPADHIDIIEVCPGVRVSQKQFVARNHHEQIWDLPYSPATALTLEECINLANYCEHDLDDLERLFDALKAQIAQREILGARYGMDLRSKSDAQVAEAVLKRRCEQATGQRIYKGEIDWNARFKYRAPEFIAYQMPQLQNAFELVKSSVFSLGPNGAVAMPYQLDNLQIVIGQSVYKIGIGGLHSQEKCTVHTSDDQNVLLDNDVASYYPSLILNSGEWPPAMGKTFLQEYEAIKNERLAAKALQAKLKKSGDISSPEYLAAMAGNEGGKIMINGTFGKTGSPYSVLFAPSMLIQTTITGQLSLLMLIEWHEAYGIPVVSANTDGIIIKCPRDRVEISKALIAEWQRRTSLEMETTEYKAVYSRDVNNYFAVKTDGEVKRKGEYSKAGLLEKKNPEVEICSDAVADFLAHGTPILHTIAACRDIRKFVAIQKVNGGGVKMWGHGPIKGAQVGRDMVPVLEANGWSREGRQWRKGQYLATAQTAYTMCFEQQTPEYLGKVCRWYYSTNAPGPIVYASNGNTVSLSYGARPCMTLPKEFPIDIDYEWYNKKACEILIDIGK